jgi:glycosyltransferase involved in cell wall biosynthesis
MKRIGILVVAYNAASTLAQVLDRIPRDFVPRISEILVCDDDSQDSTYLVGLGYQRVDRIGTALRPTLFAYQFLYELEPTHQGL